MYILYLLQVDNDMIELYFSSSDLILEVEFIYSVKNGWMNKLYCKHMNINMTKEKMHLIC